MITVGYVFAKRSECSVLSVTLWLQCSSMNRYLGRRPGLIGVVYLAANTHQVGDDKLFKIAVQHRIRVAGFDAGA